MDSNTFALILDYKCCDFYYIPSDTLGQPMEKDRWVWGKRGAKRWAGNLLVKTKSKLRVGAGTRARIGFSSTGPLGGLREGVEHAWGGGRGRGWRDLRQRPPRVRPRG